MRLHVRAIGFLGVVLLLVSRAAYAQDAISPSSDPLLIVCADETTCAMTQPVNIVVEPTLRQRVEAWRHRFAAWRTDAGVMFPLYSGFAGLQLLDVHSTTRAIDAGAVEKNGMMSGVAGHPAALLLVKSAATAGTIYLVEKKIRKRDRVAAVATMVGANAAYAFIVGHNYRSAN